MVDMLEWAQFPDENVQGSAAWRESRKKRIGASDVPVLLGVSEFMTPYQLWEEKTGRSVDRPQTFAMERGLQAEAKIAELYERKTGVKLDKFIAESKNIIPLVASLDGFNRSTNRVVEFKYPSKSKHEAALRGEVPEMYLWQIQAQIECTNADGADYVSYDGSDIVIVPVERNEDMIAKISKEVPRFWKFVESDTPPPLSDRDYAPIGGEHRLLVDDFLAINAEFKIIESKLKAAKQALLNALSDRRRYRGFGVRINRYERKGAIDYSKIDVLKTIDLESYRKPPVLVESVEVES